MAKIKVRPHPGALAKILNGKGMTQLDAAKATLVDRKTLAKIDRGDEVKQETLQKLAKNLVVPLTYFEPPLTKLAEGETIKTDEPKYDASVSTDLMLAKLDASRLAKMLRAAGEVRWKLNVHVVDAKAREVLENLEESVKDIHKNNIEWHEDEWHSLRFQLQELQKVDNVARLLEQLAEHRVTVLGADYLVWKSEKNISLSSTDGGVTPRTDYDSSRIVLLSVEPLNAQPHRLSVYVGREPPKAAPDEDTIIFVNGLILGVDGSLDFPF